MSIGGQWMNLLTDAINTFLKNIWFKGIMRNCAPMLWNVGQTVKIPYGQRTVEFAVQIFGEEPVRMVSQTPQIPVLSIRRWSLLEAASDPLFPLSSFSSSDVYLYLAGRWPPTTSFDGQSLCFWCKNEICKWGRIMNSPLIQLELNESSGKLNL